MRYYAGREDAARSVRRGENRGADAARRRSGHAIRRFAGPEGGRLFRRGTRLASLGEPGSLVVRADLEERDHLLEDAPEVYYVTDYYRRHPVVLARLARLDPTALRDLLSVSLRLTRPKMRKRRGR